MSYEYEWAVGVLTRTAVNMGYQLDEGELQVRIETIGQWTPAEWARAEQSVIRDEDRFPNTHRWLQHLQAARRTENLRNPTEARELDPERGEGFLARCPVCEETDEVERLDVMIDGRGWSCGRCRLVFSGSKREHEHPTQTERRAARRADEGREARVDELLEGIEPSEGWAGVRRILERAAERPLYRRCMDCGSNEAQGPGCPKCTDGRILVRNPPPGRIASRL